MFLCSVVAVVLKANELELTDRTRIAERLTGGGAQIEYEGNGNVRFIYLSNRCSDAELALIRAFPEVRYVQIRSTRITDAGLAHLRALPSLQLVDEIPAQITDRGIEFLADVKDLRSLRLPPKATDACMTNVAKMKRLTRIRLSPQITDEGFRHIIGLPKLTSIDVGESRVTDAGIEQLIANHSKLASLDLSQSEFVTTKSLRGISWLPQFQLLRGPKDYNNETLKYLGQCRLVQVIKAGEYPNVTDEGLQYLANLRWLSSLQLGPGITDAGMVRLAQMKQYFAKLDLRNTKVTGVGLAALRKEGVLDLYLPPTVSDDGLECLEQFRYVQFLILSGGYTDKALDHVAKLQSLTTLNLERTNVTEQGILEFRKRHPLVFVSVINSDGTRKNYGGR